MGRPRIVRTPEEQAACDQRRREQERERARRRRADAAVRAQERARVAERKQQQRTEDPAAYQAALNRDTERKRRWRADSAKRETELLREAQLKRQRRAEAAAVRAEQRQHRLHVTPKRAPCLHHSYGQLVDQLSCVTPMMLPCTCSKELNGTSTSQHVDSEVVTTTTKTEPEESAASDEEFFEMPLAVEMETGEGPCNLPVSIKEEPLDIPAVPTEDAGEADEILGVTGIETLVVAAQCRAKGEAEIGSRTSEEEACSS
ncbi:uncharacterized protein LOC144145604 isoform X2 [Haemaphysalis longicornis]